MDTNILISGIFFSGLESTLLKQASIDFTTSDVNYAETLNIVKRKFTGLDSNILNYTLKKIEDAFLDIKIIQERDWKTKLNDTGKYLRGNDQKIFAAVLFAKPDYLVTHDRDFYKREIKRFVKVVNTRTLLRKLEIIE